MKPITLFMALFAFLLFMKDGQRVMIPDALGMFFETATDGKPACSFYDKEGKRIVSIYEDAIAGMMFYADEKLATNEI